MAGRMYQIEQGGAGARGLVVDDDGQQRGIDLEAAVVFDEAERLELFHEEVHAGPRRPDHFGERFLRDFRQDPLWLVALAIAREQEKPPRQPLLARVEQL